MRLAGIIAMTVIGGAMSSTAFSAVAADGVAEGASCLVGTALARAEAFSSPLGGTGEEGETQALAQAAPAQTQPQSEAPHVAMASSSGGECLRGVRMDAALSAGTALAGDLNEMPLVGEESPAAAPASVAVREQPAAPAVAKEKKTVAVAASPAAAAPVARKKSKPVSVAKAGKISEAFKPWWPKAAEGKLNLAYAGPAAFDSAIVLLFDKSFETADLSNAQIKVIDGSGNQVKSQWVVSSGNKKMLTAKVPEGRYLVKVGPKLASMDGSTVVGEFGGPVLVGLK